MRWARQSHVTVDRAPWTTPSWLLEQRENSTASKSLCLGLCHGNFICILTDISCTKAINRLTKTFKESLRENCTDLSAFLYLPHCIYRTFSVSRSPLSHPILTWISLSTSLSFSLTTTQNNSFKISPSYPSANLVCKFTYLLDHKMDTTPLFVTQIWLTVTSSKHSSSMALCLGLDEPSLEIIMLSQRARPQMENITYFLSFVVVNIERK